MHENIKDILHPLRLLRKGGYRLFSYEERINKNIDLNMFKSKEQMKIFVNSIKEEFKSDEILQAKTNTPEELDQIMKRETQANAMKYIYNEEKGNAGQVSAPCRKAVKKTDQIKNVSRGTFFLFSVESYVQMIYNNRNEK